MKITPILKLDKSSKKSPIFIRLRDRYDGKDFQSTINVGFSIEPKYFNDGSISSRSINYHEINEEITSIITELRIILSELKREDKIPLPNLVKHRYFEKIKQKSLIHLKSNHFREHIKNGKKRKGIISRIH